MQRHKQQKQPRNARHTHARAHTHTHTDRCTNTRSMSRSVGEIIVSALSGVPWILNTVEDCYVRTRPEGDAVNRPLSVDAIELQTERAS